MKQNHRKRTEKRCKVQLNRALKWASALSGVLGLVQLVLNRPSGCSAGLVGPPLLA